MRCGTALVSCALCVASILGGAWMSRPTPVDYGPVLATASDMYAVTDAEGEPVRWYVVGKGGAGNGASADSGNSGSTDTDSANSDSGTSKVSRIPASAATLPWKVSVTYSLDGPNVEANEVAGASGLIGVYIDIKPQTKEANRTIPVVAFTVPTQVADDVSADNSITVTMQGSNTVVAAAGKAATGLEFSCYMNAKDFSMSSVALAVLPSNSSSPAVGANPDAANAAAQPAADTDVAQLTASAATLVDALTDAGSGEQQQLIEQLQTLRDNERALNKSVVAERETAHKRTFEDYMAAYVGLIYHAPVWIDWHLHPVAGVDGHGRRTVRGHAFGSSHTRLGQRGEQRQCRTSACRCGRCVGRGDSPHPAARHHRTGG